MKNATNSSNMTNVLPILVDNYGRYSDLLCAMSMIISVTLKFMSMIGRNNYVSRLWCTQRAKLLLIRDAQRRYYGDIMNFLESPSNERVPCLVKQYHLYLDKDRLIRCRGRLENCANTVDAASPILLPRESHFTKLLIMDIHERCCHFGVSYILSEVRELYWLPKARQTIKNIIRKCVTCRKVQGRPYSAPPHAPLPAERVNEAKPFDTVGIDYSGVIYAKDCVGRLVKVYIALFTCAITRAIHLELVESCTEEDFLSAFCRFTARRSVPSLIISDNAATFEAASKTLSQLYHDDRVRKYFDMHNISWKFITKRAPWKGGFYERLIGLTKNALKKVVGSSLLSVKELQTLLPQIECKINDRPLTYVSGELEDIQQLTPSMLIYGYKLGSLPNTTDTDEVIDPSYNQRDFLINMSDKLSKKVKDLWVRWRTEYLQSLRDIHVNNRKSSETVIDVGEVVLIHDDLSPRIRWRLGVITEIFRSSDGYIRSVKLRTSSGITNRPVTKLYPLEVRANETKSSDGVEAACSRPKRAAGVEALRRIKDAYAS